MISKKRIFCFIFTVVLLLLFASCENENEDFYGGEKLSPEALQSIENLICETTAEKYPEQTSPEGTVICFWTENGTVYHRSENCSRLKNSSVINSGAIDEALSLGKEKTCSTCYK